MLTLTPYSDAIETGAVMSSSDRGRGDNATGREAPNAKASSAGTDADPYASWLDRMQRADRVKDTWDDETPAPAAPKK
jgi:hypothetical protein